MPSLSLRKGKKPEKESVSKVLKESVEILDTKSTSGHMLTKSASLTGLALANSAKLALLTDTANTPRLWLASGCSGIEYKIAL